jgi:hypothetical protein
MVDIEKNLPLPEIVNPEVYVQLPAINNQYDPLPDNFFHPQIKKINPYDSPESPFTL